MYRPFSLTLLSLLLGAAAVGEAQAVRATPGTSSPVNVARATISIDSPSADEVLPGVAIIRFRTGNIVISSPFQPPVSAGALPVGHLHVTVDGTEWHWMHTSAEPVVITPLSPGVHTVTLELAGADHRPLATASVRFTIAPKAPHEGHHVAPPKSP